MNLAFGILLNFGLAALAASQTTYSSTSSVTAATTTATTSSVVVTTSSTTTVNDDFYKGLLQALAYDCVGIQQIACANAKTQNQGLFLSTITSIDADIKILLNLGNSSAGSAGATCLSANQVIGSDMLSVIAHANDNIGCPANLTRTITDGISGGGLTGEAYYQCCLQELGQSFNALIAGGKSATGTGGTYQQQIVKWDIDIDAVQKVVNTNDSSQNCINVIISFGNDVQLMFTSIGVSGGPSCPTSSSITTVITGSTTTASVTATGYGYGK